MNKKVVANMIQATIFGWARKLGLIALILLIPISAKAQQTAKATFAAGCFWCAEHDFETLPGMISVVSGYTGGEQKQATYEKVSAGGTKHYEAIEVTYNPEKISYQQLLDFFWRNIDPTDDKGQFCDKGDQYRAAIFYHDAQQKQLAEASKEQLVRSGRFEKVVTQILPASPFYPAEEYHQQYADKNPIRYKFYRYTCGRDRRLQELWGK